MSKDRIIWIISLSAAFFAGYAVSWQNSESTSSELIKPKVSEQDFKESKKGPNKSFNRAKVNQPRYSTRTTDFYAQDIIDELQLIFGPFSYTKDYSKISKARKLIDKLTADEILEIIYLIKDEASRDNEKAFHHLILKLAELAPHKAVTLYESGLLPFRLKSRVLDPILNSWTKLNPESAYKWHEKLVKDKQISDRFYLSKIFRGLATKDMDLAINKLEKLDGNRISSAVNGIVETLKHEEEFIELIERFNEYKDKKVMSSTINGWISRSPVDAKNWLEREGSEMVSLSYNSNIFNSWAEYNPEQAAEWFYEKSYSKESALQSIITKLQWSKPDFLLDLIEDKAATPNSQRYIEDILKWKLDSNLNFVIENLDRISHQRSKRELSIKIYQRLMNDNQERAEEFLKTSTFKEEILDDISNKGNGLK